MAFDWRRAGLFGKLVQHGSIRSDEWRRAVADGSFVGTCRVCGGFLRPDAPQADESRTSVEWYTAACVLCGHEYAAPNGNTLGKRHLFIGK